MSKEEKDNPIKGCPYCQNPSNDYVVLNQTVEYSGVEISLDSQGSLRVRTYPQTLEDNFDLQDIVEIKYCPNCGRRFGKRKYD